jgi:hypothetical protein
VKLPCYDELILTTRMNTDYLVSDLRVRGLGEVPIVLNATKLSAPEFKSMLDDIDMTLNRLKVSPILPYPVYLLTKEIKVHPFLTVVESYQELPKHFKIKKKRATNREAPLLNKLSILAQKVANNQVDKRQREIRKATMASRKIIENARKLHFYGQISRKLSTLAIKGHNHHEKK